MSSVKCPNCDLTNFASALYCKRCNGALQQPPAAQQQSSTQIYDTAKDTHIRPIAHIKNNDSYQGNEQNPYQKSPPNHFGQDYRQNQYKVQNQPAPQNQNRVQHQQQQQQQNYSQNQYGQQQQNDSYALPQFPKGERPIKFNHYQKNRYQPMLEQPYRKLGSDIALHKNATLPEICVSCGQQFTVYSGGRYVAQKFRWHHPAVYAALISPLIYAILAACLSERFTVSVPLCSAHIEKRENLGQGLFIGSLIAVLLIILLTFSGYFLFSIFIFVVSSILISLNYEYGYRSLRVTKVEGSYYHLKGASNEFMHSLPY